MTEGILNKLLEKKHLETYCKARKSQLRDAMEKVKSLPLKERQNMLDMNIAKVKELDFLLKVLHQEGFKSFSLNNWNYVYGKSKKGDVK